MTGTQNPRIWCDFFKKKNFQSKGSYSAPMPPKVSHLIFIESFFSKYFQVSNIDKEKEFLSLGFEDTCYKNL